MKRFGTASGVVLAALGAGALASAGSAQDTATLNALAKLRAGLWELRDLDNRGEPIESVCVADPNILMQIQHRNSPCSRLVIGNGPEAATVHYTCPAQGFGRTSIRVETPRLARIDTQGISSGIPFAYRLEARRLGPCPGGGGSR